jgi:hypothetical protein
MMPDLPSPSTERDTRPDLAREVARAHARREALGVERPMGDGKGQWGLALSGGGIRSATFCLGVLQGLTKAGPPPSGDGKPAGKALLPQFDYVSTVSGGGYAGGFFSSLFVKSRLDRSGNLDHADTARQAYRVFAEEPPERLRSEVRFDAAHPGRAALAWLRENGRYMAPNGAGDMLYAAAIHIRNWFAAHYVLGIALVFLFAVLALVRATLLALGLDAGDGSLLKQVHEHEKMLFDSALACGDACGWKAIWWSTVWWLAIPVLALWSLPTGIAFWFTQQIGGGRSTDTPERFTVAVQVAIFIGIALLSLYSAAETSRTAWTNVARLTGAAGLVTLLGAAWYIGTAGRAESVAEHRVLLTRRLKESLVALAEVSALAVLDTAAQTIYLQWESLWKLATPAALVGAVVWLARRFAEAASQKGDKGLLARMPLPALGAIAGGTLALLVALVWALAVQWIRWNGEVPVGSAYTSSAQLHGAVLVLAWAAAVGLLLSMATGLFPGFLNLSTLQGLYSARLTRAYLGASNSMRFEPGNERLRSVAEPCKEDYLSVEALYDNPNAPMHIVNVCLNQTADPGENLVQRDRKGRPLSLAPPGGLWLDREGHPMPKSDKLTEVAAPMSVGDWIGVSGAAFSTGLGRGTSVGMSLLLGLANVRLGRWWPTGIHLERVKTRDKGLRWLFRTQFYLASELLARFHGTRREWQYLTDGGHFENTAVYELLRPDRDVSLVVCCDCGADPDYTFEDLANLTRLARIDFGIELTVDFGAAADPVLGQVFGTFADFQATATADSQKGKCAVLVRVSNRFKSDGTALPDARIVFLKPRVLPDSSIDLRHYKATHSTFPQETTMDQFFDEAQWESYRRLGREVAMRVFRGPGGDPAYAKALADCCRGTSIAIE